MRLLWTPKKQLYDGSQMAPQWAYERFGITGDCAVAFEGPCRVPRSKMLDLEDRRAGSRIAGPRMVHWIVEHFDMDLVRGVLRQRLLATLVREEIERISGRRLVRKGDDLYDRGRKLSISIAALTPVSCKIHFAVNVVRAPRAGVATEGISAYGIPPRQLGERVLRAYAAEMRGVEEARCRARAVR